MFGLLSVCRVSYRIFRLGVGGGGGGSDEKRKRGGRDKSLCQ